MDFASSRPNAVAPSIAALLIVVGACAERTPPARPARQAAAPPPTAPVQDPSEIMSVAGEDEDSEEPYEEETVSVREEGDCGGLAALAFDTPKRVLRDRVRMRLPRNAAVGPLPREMTMVSSIPSWVNDTATFARGEASMMVIANELFRRADTLRAEDVLRVTPAGSRILPLDPQPEGVIAVVPRRFTLRAGMVTMLTAYVRTPDGYVVSVDFAVDPELAERGGCGVVARTVAATLTSGAGRLRLATGPRTVSGGLALDVPSDHALVELEGEDFFEITVRPIAPLGAPSAVLAVVAGNDPWPNCPDDAPSTPARVLGRDVAWRTCTEEGKRIREVIVERDSLHVHVTLEAEGSASMDVLERAAASLREVPIRLE